MLSRYDISFSNERVKSDFKRYNTDPNFQRVFKEVIESIKYDPFGQKDIKGKPELLRGNYSGHWSRRLNKEHRVVYTVLPNGIVKIVEVGEHYQRSK
ncbi:MAG: Txe/YoeB family addiction module toxin [Alphaproteobacteria bacterium]|nr:Txe/YoeB family addiction module toxin [Alphaproteobacteria bacterium]MBP7729295.1 Txe/YoeB family addiction module toxin [Alphaproteobacteria bacterium]